MGKSKRKNRQTDQLDSSVRPSKPPADPELAAIREQKILPVMLELTCPDAKSRSLATNTIVNLIKDKKCRKMLLREKLVRTVMQQTITDTNPEVSVAGWDVLQNLAAAEDWDFSLHLYREDILTPLAATAQLVTETVGPNGTLFQSLSKAQQQLTWSLAKSIVGIVSSLAQTKQDVVEALSVGSLPTFLFNLIARPDTPAEILESALVCLNVLTEENDVLAALIRDHHDWLTVLVCLKDQPNLVGVASCGTLYNIIIELRQSQEEPVSLPEFSDVALLHSLGSVLRHGYEAIESRDVTKVSGHFPDNYSKIIQLALEIVASMATALQGGTEGISKQEDDKFEGFGDDDLMVDDLTADGGDEEAEMHGNGGMDSEYERIDMEMVTGDESGKLKSDKTILGDETVLKPMIEEITPSVLRLAMQAAKSQALSEIYSRALAALNNISWTVAAVTDGVAAFSSWPRAQTWLSLGQQIWAEAVAPVVVGNTADIKLASSITSLAWALSRSIGSRLTMQADEPRKFMALYQASLTLPAVAQPKLNQKPGSEEPGNLGVKCIGVLGGLAMSPCPVALNREIGTFLLAVLASLPNTPAADAVEALNQLFDIYADADYEYDETVFRGDGFLKHLEEVVPKAKKMAKSVDKRKFPDLREAADDAVTNLGRFIKYKKDELS